MVSQQKIGQTLVNLDGERSSCRLGECILGNLVTDAAVFQVASKNMATNVWTSASVALWTANSIMASIYKNKTGKGFSCIQLKILQAQRTQDTTYELLYSITR